MTIGSDAGRACFDDAPVAMFVEDIGGVRRRLEELRAELGDDLTAHLAAHPEAAARLASLVRIVDANREAVRFFEATSKADLERALPPYFDERALAVFAEAVAAVARGVTRYDCELPLRTARGGTKLVAVSLSIGLGGSPDALVISFVDVTERLRMEAEIRAALRINQLILDTAPLGVITFKASGECVAANQTAAAIIGGTVPQLLEKRRATKLAQAAAAKPA